MNMDQHIVLAVRSSDHHMFKEGALVMYGTMGVCQIKEIGRPDFAEDSDATLYYFLEPIYKSGTFYAPIDNKKVSIRKIISKNAAKKYLEDIDGIKPEIISSPSVQQLSQHYQDIIEKHTVEDLLFLIKSIDAKEKECAKNNKKLGQIDKRFMKKAEELLYGEFSVALGKRIDEVETLIKERL